jgi:hypothetical protein
VEFASLDAVARTGFPLSKAIYLFLEGIACTRPFNRDYVKTMLTNCAFCIIASEERGRDIDKHFGLALDFEYVPVSMRPPLRKEILANKKGSVEKGELNIVYSGYIAEWSCLGEFIELYRRLPMFERSRLCIHGHKMGTKRYYKAVVAKVKGMKGVTVDQSYYVGEGYHEFLSRFDIGLAFYKNYINSSDWDNLMFSSGKIASYLWAGMAVMTNILHPLSMRPPFLYVESINEVAVSDAILHYHVDREGYQKAARECAAKFYNIEVYMDRVIDRIEGMGGRGDEREVQGGDGRVYL